MLTKTCHAQLRRSLRAPARSGKPLPSISPMLATLGSIPDQESAFSFEFKWDGIRAITYWDGAELRILSRNANDITAGYPELNALGKSLGKTKAILDGEIIAQDGHGRPSFPQLQRRMHVRAPGAALMRSVPATYVIFDLLYLNASTLIGEPYFHRRALLEGVVSKGPAWDLSPSHINAAGAMMKIVREEGLEGIVAKRLDSTYEAGKRSPAWVKIKQVHGQEFVVGGWIPQEGSNGHRVGSLLIGYYGADARLHFAGGVGSGFDEREHERLVARLTKMEQKTGVFAERFPRAGARFVKPKLVVHVEYRRWPDDGLVQQGAYKGIRADKEAGDVVKEHPSFLAMR